MLIYFDGAEIKDTTTTTTTTPSYTTPSQQPSWPYNNQPKFVINPPATQLAFDQENIDLFFQRFESRYRHEHLQDAELFKKLLQCLNNAQQCRMHSVLSL